MIMNMGGEDSMYMLHPARLFINYNYSESLQLRFGQIHTPIGIYSQRYPMEGKSLSQRFIGALSAHGRGETSSFHTLGFNARGTMMVSDSLELMYIVGVGNGYSLAILTTTISLHTSN